MLGFFKDRRDINQVIFEIAEHKRPRDHRRLCELLRGRELFAAVEATNVPFEPGGQLIVRAGDNIQLRTGRLLNGMVGVVFYVDRNDSRLTQQYIGLAAAAAFEMVSKMAADVLLIQNAQDSWVAFPREELAAIRAKYL